MQCPTCREKLPEQYSFCPYCGTQLYAHLCPVCKTRAVPGARFCVFCGSNLSQTTSINRPMKEPGGEVNDEMRERGDAEDTLLLNFMSGEPIDLNRSSVDLNEPEEEDLDVMPPEAWELTLLTDLDTNF